MDVGICLGQGAVGEGGMSHLDCILRYTGQVWGMGTSLITG